MAEAAPFHLEDEHHPSGQHLRPGSNNWVMSGAHTASGKPLLSNDMHLDLRDPERLVRSPDPTAGDFAAARLASTGAVVDSKVETMLPFNFLTAGRLVFTSLEGLSLSADSSGRV